MIFKSIELRNFRSYNGTQRLELDPIDDNRLIVIYGENMSGKTSLFLAINWCLYGKAYGRRGEEIPIYSPGEIENNYLLNAKALDDEDYSIGVKIEWEHSGDIWILDRSFVCDGNPLLGDTFESKVSLKIGGAVKTRQEIEQRINELLHYQAAQFYFFDGELLSQYEQWLDNSEEREVRVKNAIENTVGTAALRLYGEIQKVADEASDEQDKLVRRERRADRLVEEHVKKVSEKRELESELQDYIDRLSDLEDESQRIEKDYGALADFAKEQNRLIEIERSIERDQNREESANQKIRDLLGKCYWLPLASVTEEMYRSIESSLIKAIELSSNELRSILSSNSLQDDECDLCGQALDTQSRSRLEDLLDFPLADTSMNLNNIKHLVSQLSQLDTFRTIDRLGELKLLEDERLNARSDIYDNSEKAKGIRTDHSDRPRGDLDKQMKRLETIREEIIDTKNRKEEASMDLDKVDTEISKLRTQIHRIEIDPRVQRKAMAADLAVEATKRALEEFRESARHRVEIEASKVFKMLVKEPGYYGIRIDNDYRVTPVDSSGIVLPIPSAGGQQLVTLALVGGLNAAATHQAPIVMDTPAGRVDKRNRERVLHWISEINEQAILMVHSGEFTREEIEATGIPIAYAYEIEKTGAKTSEIRSVSND